MPDRDRAIGFEARSPELILDMNGGQRRGTDGIILHLGLRERKGQDHQRQADTPANVSAVHVRLLGLFHLQLNARR
jgi:hypothetical protein